MKNISVELVPRTGDNLKKELQLIKNKFDKINTINIPDLLRFEIRSWNACEIVKKYFNSYIPHFRSIDFDIHSEFKLKEIFKNNNIKEIIIIRGDEPQGMTKKIYPTTSIELTKKLKKEIPDLKIYGSIDQYRTSFKSELDYIQMKIDAGMDGFFTQPFFDLRLFEIFLEKLDNLDVYWGISPVISEQSRLYWETRNRAIFPKSFNPTIEWNVKFAQNVLQIIQNTKMNLYFMPIKIDINDYLEKVFEE